MIDTIEAAFPATVEPGFKTPAEAIAFSQWIARARDDKDLSSCIGRTIRLADWCDDAIFLHLDDGHILHFGCARRIVDLTIEKETKSNVALRSQASEEVLLRLAGEASHWKRGELMRALQGNTVQRIQPGQTLYFLYVTNVGLLLISVLVNRSTGPPFLHWGLTD